MKVSPNIVGGFFLLVLCVVVFVAASYFYRPKAEAPARTSYETSPLTKEYTNDTYRFSLMMPDAFVAQELPNDEGSDTTLLQDSTGNGIQIMVSPYGQDLHELTAEKIHTDIPDMKISDVQSLEIGDDYKGVAFKSDNPAFNKDSRDVWFVFHGTLYQITTYASNDSLLKAMFGTWKFF